MIVRFWGTRGSIPVAPTAAAVRRKLVSALVQAAGRDLKTEAAARAFVERELEFAVSGTFGGETSCVQLEGAGDDYVLCDLGSGARRFSLQVMGSDGARRANTFHVFMSHLHWDHIMGFPFFMPAYVPGNLIRIYGCHEALPEAFRRQHGAPSFPVEWSGVRARVEFVHLRPGQAHEVAGLRVTPKLQRHAGDSYGYRFEIDGRTVVYSTDSEHKLDDREETRAFVAFFQDADLVIFDSQYSLAEAVTFREDWGHSSNIVGVELCQMARARHLCLYHHEPNLDDVRLAAVLRETRRLEEITRRDHRLEISAAYDGLEVVL
jgi:phosphoribosyl 1,2-cyclic phosphodiesterase